MKKINKVKISTINQKRSFNVKAPIAIVNMKKINKPT